MRYSSLNCLKIRNIAQERLDEHLAVLKSRGEITIWHKEMVLAGQGWEEAANEALYAADIILILVSADFLASERQYEVEMKNALERHKQGNTIVVPIILRDCLWNLSELGKLQVLPTNKIPITNLKHWGSIDAALANVANGINKVVDGMIRRKDTGQILPIVIQDLKQTKNTQTEKILLGGLFVLIMLAAVFGMKMWLDQPTAKKVTAGTTVSKPIEEDTSSVKPIKDTLKPPPIINTTSADIEPPVADDKPTPKPKTKSQPKPKPNPDPVKLDPILDPEPKPDPPKPQPVAKNNNEEYSKKMEAGNAIIAQIRNAQPSVITPDKFEQIKRYYTTANQLKSNITIPPNIDEYGYCAERGLRYARNNECGNAEMWLKLALLIKNNDDIAVELNKCQ
ncbi:MAG: TIR domain-containing protein [Sphingobacteriales bacterium]|nr:TIR domain-containing protein [Sphingobacteriales bacterium]